MIVTIIKIHGRAQKRKEIVQTVKDLVTQLTKEGGCTKADLYQDLDDKNTFFLMEEWQSREALEKYKTSKSLAVLLGLETLLAESVEINHAVKL